MEVFLNASGKAILSRNKLNLSQVLYDNNKIMILSRKLAGSSR